MTDARAALERRFEEAFGCRPAWLALLKDEGIAWHLEQLGAPSEEPS